MKAVKTNLLLWTVLIAVILLAVTAIPGLAFQKGKSPLKVFILAGQSNMEGKGSVKSLEYFVNNPETAPDWKHLKTRSHNVSLCESSTETRLPDRVTRFFVAGSARRRECERP